MTETDPDKCTCIHREDGYRTLSKNCPNHKSEINFKGQLQLEKLSGSDIKLSKHIYGMTDLYNTVVRDYLTARSISRTVALLDRERT